MSQTGQIVLYSVLETRPGEISSLCRELGILQASTVTRSLAENRGWEEFVKGEDPWPAEETVGYRTESKMLEQLYVPGRTVSAECEGEEVVEIIRSGVMSLGVDVRGSFCPTCLYITMGWHDLIEDNEHPNGLLIARPFVSIKFWGYGTPEIGWSQARNLFLSLDAVKTIALRCEKAIRPIESYAYWSA